MQLCVYDPEVEDSQIYQDLGTKKFEWDHPSPRSAPIAKTAIEIATDPMEAARDAHAICVLTEVRGAAGRACGAPLRASSAAHAAAELHAALRRPPPLTCPLPPPPVARPQWDEFKTYNYQKVYDSMVKPAFIFDGRNILDHAKLRCAALGGGGRLARAVAVAAPAAGLQAACPASMLRLPHRHSLLYPAPPVQGHWLHRVRGGQAAGPLPAEAVRLSAAAAPRRSQPL